MMKMSLILGVLFATSAFAQAESLKTISRDVSVAPTPGPSSDSPVEGIDISKIIAIGEKVWDYVINHKPDAQYTPLKASVVPAGVKVWTELEKWSKPVAKTYHVEFKNMFGGYAGGFDYRISYIAGGSYKGKGKFIGQISVMPTNIDIRTDRTLKMKAELVNTLNFGTEEDPIAGAQILISWDSPTTTRYEMQSAEYFIFGTGEIQDLNATLE